MAPIVPDSKNWTWVLDRACPECGYFVGELDPIFVPDVVRQNAAVWQQVLAGENVAVRTRDDRWSTLEYGAHVRDVFRVFHARISLMLNEDNPTFENWDQDATAIAESYGTQDPAKVAAELAAAAEEIATLIESITPDDWQRGGRRSDGSAFTLYRWVQYFAHDPLHHLWDVTGQGGGRS